MRAAFIDAKQTLASSEVDTPNRPPGRCASGSTTSGSAGPTCTTTSRAPTARTSCANPSSPVTRSRGGRPGPAGAGPPARPSRFTRRRSARRHRPCRTPRTCGQTGPTWAAHPPGRTPRAGWPSTCWSIATWSASSRGPARAPRRARGAARRGAARAVPCGRRLGRARARHRLRPDRPARRRGGDRRGARPSRPRPTCSRARSSGPRALGADRDRRRVGRGRWPRRLLRRGARMLRRRGIHLGGPRRGASARGRRAGGDGAGRGATGQSRPVHLEGGDASSGRSASTTRSTRRRPARPRVPRSSSVITHVLPADDAEGAFAVARDSERSGKVVVAVWPGDTPAAGAQSL